MRTLIKIFYRSGEPEGYYIPFSARSLSYREIRDKVYQRAYSNNLFKIGPHTATKEEIAKCKFRIILIVKNLGRRGYSYTFKIAGHKPTVTIYSIDNSAPKFGNYLALLFQQPFREKTVRQQIEWEKWQQELNSRKL